VIKYRTGNAASLIPGLILWEKSMDLMKQMKEKARQKNRSIVLPDSDDDRIFQAAEILIKEGIARPILLGELHSVRAKAKQSGVDLSGAKVIDPKDENLIEKLCADSVSTDGLPEKATKRMLRDPLCFGARLVRAGMADTMVAGLNYTTGEVVVASQTIIGMEEGIDTPSSMFLLRVPGYNGSEKEYLIFADGAVCPDPTPEELADIAVATARTAERLLDWEPRVAMISFSTKGSANHPKAEQVLAALEIVKTRYPELLIDGELQVDAAIVPEVAAAKAPGDSPVAGRANILIFPDLNAANSAYKLVQRLANADAYGALLQGFAKSVSDLSRGATVEDIIGIAVMTIARSE
jgi:phosphate acetyltransferase